MTALTRAHRTALFAASIEAATKAPLIVRHASKAGRCRRAEALRQLGEARRHCRELDAQLELAEFKLGHIYEAAQSVLRQEKTDA